MQIQYYLSGSAVIISIIFGIIAIRTSWKANRLHTEVLNLSKQTNEFEVKKGEILMMAHIGRYFVFQLNCWEFIGSGKMKTDKISIQQYINEMRQLHNDINNLISNPFYIEILKKYPEINLLWILLRYSIIGMENSSIMGINPQLFEKFCDLYYKIKNEVDDKALFKNQYYITIDEAVELLKKVLPTLKRV